MSIHLWKCLGCELRGTRLSNHLTIDQSTWNHEITEGYIKTCKQELRCTGKLKPVGGIPTPLKNMKVNRKDDIPYMKCKIKCFKPPTSISLLFTINILLWWYIPLIYYYDDIKPPTRLVNWRIKTVGSNETVSTNRLVRPFLGFCSRSAREVTLPKKRPMDIQWHPQVCRSVRCYFSGYQRFTVPW
jgi:hypothetical protein